MAGMFSYFLVNSSIKNTTRKSGVFVCPMSSVSAWSTAAAARSATARARHESPVISAVIDEEVTDFSAFSFYLIREGVKEVNPWTPAFHTCIPYGHLGNLWMTSFHSAGLSHPSTI